MVKFLIKAAFVGEALIKGRRLLESAAVLIWVLALIRGGAVKLVVLSIASKKQNKLRKFCLLNFVLKTDIIAIGKV